MRRASVGLTIVRGDRSMRTMASLIDNPQRARQLARAIASDLTLYHEAKILEGITNDTLFDVMAEEIAEGRQLFKSRVTEDIFGQNIYDRAIVDVLIKSKGHGKSKIWCPPASSSPPPRRASGSISSSPARTSRSRAPS